MIAAIELTVAAILVVAYSVVAARYGLPKDLLEYSGYAAERINPGERTLLIISLVTALPASVLAADAFARLSVGASLRTIAMRAPRRTIALAALLASALSMFVAWRVLGFAPFTDDERVYLFQSRSYLAGHVSVPVPAPSDAFSHQFVVPVGDRRAGIFPPGQPALLAIGLLFGHANLTQYLCCAAIVWITASFAREEWGDETAVFVALLLALSPALVFTAATLHSVVPVVVCVAIVLRHTARLLRGEPAWNGAIVGAAAGLAFLCRPLDGVLLALFAATLVVLFSPRKSSLVLATLAGAPFLLAQLLVYRAISGNLFTTPYRVWLDHDFPRAKLFGFGTTVWNYQHTPRVAVSKTAAALARVNLWAFGWPISIAPLFVASRVRDRMVSALLALIGLHVAAYFFYAFGAVHDFGSYYHLFWLPALATITARVIVVAREGGAELAENGALAATFVGLLTFVPMQVRRLGPIAKMINEPMTLARAAASGPLLVVYEHGTPRNTTWVHWLPLPGPRGDDAILWSRVHNDRDRGRVAEAHPERHVVRLEWIDGHARLQLIR